MICPTPPLSPLSCQALSGSLCSNHTGHICVLQTLKFIPMSQPLHKYALSRGLHCFLLTWLSCLLFRFQLKLPPFNKIFLTSLFSITQHCPYSITLFCIVFLIPLTSIWNYPPIYLSTCPSIFVVYCLLLFIIYQRRNLDYFPSNCNS